MFDAEITTAIRDMYTELRRTDGNVVEPSWAFRLNETPDATNFLKWAMQKLVRELSARLSRAGHGGSMGLLMRSNFLSRAAWDLFGPCSVGRHLERRGEWSVVSAVRESRTRGVQSTLFSLGRSFVANVIAPSLGTSLADTSADRVDRLIHETWMAHAEFGEELITRLGRDAVAIRAMFGVQGNPTAFFVAGSDPHRSAQRVVIVSYGADRVVYKPTDLLFQALLMGTPESLVAARQHNASVRLDQSLFDVIQSNLPLLHILTTPSRAHGIHGRSGYGYMQYKARTQVVVNADARGNYFRGLGKLAAVAATLGITDLHKENVMATADGPVIIDAEMGFNFPAGAGAPLSISHTAITDAISPRHLTHSQCGGTFVPVWDARGSVWEASAISTPRTDDDINSAIRPNALAPWCSASKELDFLVEGMDAAIDDMSRRHDHVQNWFIDFLRVRRGPLARLLLNTTEMVRHHMTGITQRLNGVLQDAPTANCTFDEWLVWYAGHHHAVPGAWYLPANPQVVYDSHGVIGVPAGVATAGTSPINTIQQLRFRLAILLMGSGAARTKRALQTELERELHTTARLATMQRALAARGL